MSVDSAITLTRRQLFGRSAGGLGVAALANLLTEDLGAASGQPALPGLPHLAPRAKRVIYLFQSGGPSQMDLFDHKPGLQSGRARSCRTRSAEASGSQE